MTPLPLAAVFTAAFLLAACARMPDRAFLAPAPPVSPDATPSATADTRFALFADLPADTALYVAGAYHGQPAGIQIEEKSARAAGTFTVWVDSPERPVALLLNAYEPSIWHLRWTPGTRIVAVYAMGHHLQIVAGLPSQTQLRYAARRLHAMSAEEAPILALQAKAWFGRPVTGMLLAPLGKRPDAGQVFIGGKRPASAYAPNPHDRPDHAFRWPGTPLTGQAGLSAAEKAGILRRATDADRQRLARHYNALLDRLTTQAEATGRVLPTQGGKPRQRIDAFAADWIIEKPFRFPAGVRNVVYVLARNVPAPLGIPDNPVIDLNDEHSARGTPLARQVLALQEILRAPQEESAASGPPAFADLPSDLQVYAVGAYSGLPRHVLIARTDTHGAGEIEVFVNQPEHPVALLLTAYEPTVWRIRATPRTRLAAVQLSGYATQIVTGQPEATPVQSRTGRYLLNNDYDPLQRKTLQTAAKAAFGQPPTTLYLPDPVTRRAFIGPRLPLDAYAGKPLTAADFRLPDTPLTEKAGLDVAEAEGILRRPTPEEQKAWTQHFADKLAALSDDNPPIIGARPPSLRIDWVIQKPFTLPAGLYGGHSAKFLLLRGVPLPQGDLGHSCLIDLNTDRARVAQGKPLWLCPKVFEQIEALGGN
ncbi:MAG: hypothetical protein LBL69_05535 [Zoogloeaceae bacterium]|jgi:hypothetical protein|nr:hypothetical protein [Zoogloeaceae bacterium]